MKFLLNFTAVKLEMVELMEMVSGLLGGGGERERPNQQGKRKVEAWELGQPKEVNQRGMK